MSDKFHKVEITEPEGQRGLGSALTLDGIKIKGVKSYNYTNDCRSVKTLHLELFVDDVTVTTTPRQELPELREKPVGWWDYETTLRERLVRRPLRLIGEQNGVNKIFYLHEDLPEYFMVTLAGIVLQQTEASEIKPLQYKMDGQKIEVGHAPGPDTKLEAFAW